MAKYKKKKEKEVKEEFKPSKFYFIAGMLQAIFGFITMLVYFYVLITKVEPIGKWTITLVISILFIYMGITNIKDNKKVIKKNDKKISK